MTEDGYLYGGNHIAELYVEWEEVAFMFFECYVVSYREVGIDSWTVLPYTKDNKAKITNLVKGKTYEVKIQVKSTWGFDSSGLTTFPYTIVGKNSAPSKPTGMAFLNTVGGWTLSWNPNPEVDVAGYRLWEADKGYPFETARNIQWNYRGTTVYVPNIDGKDKTFYIAAVDTSDNVSEPVAFVALLDVPADVYSFEVLRNGENVDFRYSHYGRPLTKFEIRRGDSWGNGERFLIDLTGNFASKLFTVPGEHLFWIKAVNEYGNYSANARFAKLTVANYTPRNVLISKDYRALGWPGLS